MYKAASGAIEYINIFEVANINSTLKNLKEKNFWVYGFDGSGKKDFTDIVWKGNNILLFGSEGSGMHKHTSKYADFLVKIEHIQKPAPQKISENKSEGYIYLMRNNSLKNNIFKIGKTSKTPNERAVELSNATGVPEKFEVINYWKSSNISRDESEIFAYLDNHRYSDNREFFEIEEKKAIEKIEFILNRNS